MWGTAQTQEVVDREGSLEGKSFQVEGTASTKALR